MVTIPEGWNRFQIAARLQSQGIIRAEDFLIVTESASLLKSIGIDAPTAEGYLFPDTYQFYVNGSALTMVRTMVSNFNRQFSRLMEKYRHGLDRLKDVSHNPRRALVTLASIVEAEVQDRNELRIVAGVFFNRLLSKEFKSHLIQSDPTVKYGCIVLVPTPPSCTSFTGQLTRRQLSDPNNLYNTYIYPGLPPGPICNPGYESLKAVLNPVETDYFYFVSKGDGTHHFSKTFEEHQKAVERYRRRRK